MCLTKPIQEIWSTRGSKNPEARIETVWLSRWHNLIYIQDETVFWRKKPTLKRSTQSPEAAYVNGKFMAPSSVRCSENLWCVLNRIEYKREICCHSPELPGKDPQLPSPLVLLPERLGHVPHVSGRPRNFLTETPSETSLGSPLFLRPFVIFFTTPRPNQFD